MKEIIWSLMIAGLLQAQVSAFAFSLQGGIVTQGAGTLYVGPSRPYQTINEVLAYLSDKKIAGDVTIAVDPGLYTNVDPILITHQDAHRISIVGNSALSVDSIMLSSGAIVSTTAKDVSGNASFGPASNVDYYEVVITIPSADVGKVSAGDYVLIRDTSGDLDDAHQVFQGTWEVAAVQSSSSQITIKHRYPLYPFPENENGGLLNITGGQIIVLNTVLKFYASSAFVVEGRQLQSLKNLAIIGDYRPAMDPEDLYASNPGLTSNEYATVLVNHTDRSDANAWGHGFHGVQAQLGGNIKLDRYVGVAQFDGQGVSAHPACYVEADRTACSANERRGFYPTQTAYMKCVGTIASANNTDGYISDLNAVLEMESAIAAGNKENGVLALHKGRVSVKSSVSSGNGFQGFSARGGLSELMLTTMGTSKNWAVHNLINGVYAADGAEVRMAYTWSKNNLGDGIKGAPFTEWFLGTNDNSYSNGGDAWAFESPDLVESNCDYAAWTTHSMPCVSKAWSSDTRSKIILLDDDKGPYEAHYTIDPLQAQSSTNFHTLNDFFEFLDDYRIQANGKMLNVELAYGVHHCGESVVIDHPDAGRIKIYGKRFTANEYIDVRILSTVDVTEYSNFCTAELLLVEAYLPRVDVGDYINIYKSSTDDGSDHEVFQGAWEVVAKNEPANTVTVKILERESSLVARLTGSTLSGVSGGYVTAKVLKSVLKFYAADGIIIDNTLLGDLSGVCIVGDYKGLTNPPDYGSNPPDVFTNQTILDRLAGAYTNGWESYNGLYVQSNGAVNISGASCVCEFSGSGVYVSNGSVVESFLHRTLSLAVVSLSANRINGAYSVQDSTFWAKASTAAHNHQGGYGADDHSTLYVSLSTAVANRGSGYFVDDNSMLSGHSCESVFNLDHGYSAENNSHASVAESEGRENGIDGYYCYDSTGALEYSEAVGNVRDGFHFIESVGRMYNVKADANVNGIYAKDYDSLALHKTYLSAPNSVIQNQSSVGAFADKNAVIDLTNISFFSNGTNTVEVSGGIIID
ncbi:hypothetical protein [Tichowtungia aerotolerans]|uniref:Uncharacterized protein n=1 Tax=Tichowtungia aerotolerans TaxID=2697043 RepID=A0A6P1M8K2_9BACT|nr:hypothetical protein [Tichowtungia aerotolerans]QHI69393.1 hypothetical protein GT409_07985 [Tichowtungia aerotolerans]